MNFKFQIQYVYCLNLHGLNKSSVHAMFPKKQPTTTQSTTATITTTTTSPSTSPLSLPSSVRSSSLTTTSSLGAKPKTSSLSTPSTSNLKSSMAQSNVSSPPLTTKNLVGGDIEVGAKNRFGNSMKILVRNTLEDMMVLKIKTPQGEDVSKNLSNMLYILNRDVANQSKKKFINEAQKQLSSKNIPIDEKTIKTIDEALSNFSEVMSLSIGNSFNEARQKLSVVNTGNSYRDLNLMMGISKDIQSSVESSSSSNFESSIKSFVSSFR